MQIDGIEFDLAEKSRKMDERFKQAGLIIDSMTEMVEKLKNVNKGRATTLSSDEFMDRFGRKM